MPAHKPVIRLLAASKRHRKLNQWEQTFAGSMVDWLVRTRGTKPPSQRQWDKIFQILDKVSPMRADIPAEIPAEMATAVADVLEGEMTESMSSDQLAALEGEIQNEMMHEIRIAVAMEETEREWQQRQRLMNQADQAMEKALARGRRAFR